jgi:iron complex transport system substrate-binding protein
MVKRPLPLVVTARLIFGCTGDSRRAPHPRIVSYSPAVTDIVYDLGLGEHLVGVTSWCILPAGQSKPIVGGETRPNTEAILGLGPDLIFIQQDPSSFNALRAQDPRVRVISVKTDSLAGILQSIRTIGQAAGV